MQLDQAIKKRKSIRNFSNETLDWRKILQAMEYVCFVPMAGNQYSVRYILVSDKEKIKKIAEACQQEFVGKVNYLIAVVSDRNKVKKNYDYFDKGFAAQQAGAAIQTLLLGLTEKGISTCWVGFFEDSIIKRELKISESMTLEAVLPLGIESKVKRERDKLKPSLDKLISFEKFGGKNMGQDTKQTYENS